MFPRLRSLPGALVLLVCILVGQPVCARQFEYSHKVAINPSGTMFACYADQATKVQVCDMNGKELFVLPMNVRDSRNLLFMEDGNLVTDFDGYITIWDIQSRTKLAVWKRSSQIGTIVGSRRGKHLMVVDGGWLYFLTSRLQEQSRWPIHDVMAVDWAPDEKSFALCRIVQGTEIWKIGGRGGITKVSPGMGTVVRFSPDGKTLAVGESTGTLLFDVATGETTRLSQGEGAWASALAWSPDGKYLATGGGATSREWENIRVWRVTDKFLANLLPGCQKSVSMLRFLPDGKTLVANDTSLTVHVWDIEGGKTRVLGRNPRHGETGVDVNTSNLNQNNVNTGANSIAPNR